MNRLNYYETKKEASTAVATRIVNENLPKFVDNIFLFEKQNRDENGTIQNKYLEIFEFLKSKNITLKNKDGEDLYAIEKSIFGIDTFKTCLSQAQIEGYNKKIGNANFLINLYNQKQTDKKDKLSTFKILFKQIGCGEKKDFIKLIKDDNDLIEILEEMKNAGEKYFVSTNNIDEEKIKINDFVNLLKNREDYK
ncbi:MAG: hypothetical protein LBQ59_04820 [Candidatus Peribacteria bacterium]|nr:hypothetical protein [Candidatus Peribacteria bacterium]